MTSLSLMCRVSGRTSRSPTLQPDTGADSVNVVWPTSGSVATRTNVGVRGLPCMVALPKIMRPVPNCNGSATLPPSAESAMTISAVTSAAIGAAAVPTCRMPRVPMPISPAMTWRFVTFSRVLTVGGEREGAIDGDRVRDGGGVVDGDGMSQHDADDVVEGRDLAALPRARARTSCRSAPMRRSGE